MNNERSSKPLRTWPAVTIGVLAAAVIIGGPLVQPGEPWPLLGGAAGAVLILLWWLVASRARWMERFGVLLMLALAVIATKPFVDLSIDNGAQGFLAFIFGVMFYAMALGIWAVATGRMNDRARIGALIPMFLIFGTAPMLAIRTEGVKGGNFVLHWRWTPTPEEILLAQAEPDPKPVAAPAAVETPPATPAVPADATPAAPAAVDTSKPAVATPPPPVTMPVPGPAEWPGFRGPQRNGVIRNVLIRTDWNQAPPTQMWRRPVGPGWSSFSVRGDLFYTQEQRGDDEMVSCYRVSTGEAVWRHRDPIRFYESNGGAGPRGTPTIHGSQVFALGATGRLNALDAATGKLLWSHDAAADTKRDIPMWGISSSPLVVDDLVIVSLYGTLAAYDVASGKLRWVGPQHGGSYSSPHLATFGGVTQVVILSAPGAVSVKPSDGSLLWEHRWEGGAIVQPGFTEDGDILINSMAATGGVGTRRLAVSRDGESWKVDEKWTSNGLKPYFNDLVVHKGHAYGFDNNILSSIDLADGKRKWKGGRYGNGQMILLADQDLLLVVSEEGELALVSATPDQYKEIARIPVFNAKTWNHPVIVGNVLLVRNGEEMAAFRLASPAPLTTIY